MTQHEINRVISAGRVLWDALTEEEQANYKYSEGLIGFIEIVMEALHLDPETLTEEEFNRIYDTIFPSENALTPLGNLLNRLIYIPGTYSFSTVLYEFLAYLRSLEVCKSSQPQIIYMKGLIFYVYPDYVTITAHETEETLCKIDVRFD